ncbi:MAG TPA: DUF2784 domain-containing protein [Clostridia bacterium]|nr:DUF2784 domain-containing protein [Clostridia bacterium]
MKTQWAADVILVLHLLIVLFNVGALPVIWIGYLRDWRFVRNLTFRLTHLALIGFVAAESVVGVICPLTVWEEALRPGNGSQYPNGFIAYWVHRLLFYDLDQWVFTTAYIVFFLVVFLLTIGSGPAGRPARTGAPEPAGGSGIARQTPAPGAASLRHGKKCPLHR